MFVFSTYIPMFLLKFREGGLVGCIIKFCIQRVPTLHIFDRPHYPKDKKYLKKRDDDIIIIFFRYFLFLGSGVRQKYVVCILVGCGIKFCIQQSFLLKICVKRRGYMLKIHTKKLVFSFFLQN